MPLTQAGRLPSAEGAVPVGGRGVGIGFKTADTIAQVVGIPHDSPVRVKAGLQYTLSEASHSGHCYLPQPMLGIDAVKILDVPPGLIGGCLDEYLVPFHRAETSLAGALRRQLAERADRLPHFVDGTGPGRWPRMGVN